MQTKLRKIRVQFRPILPESPEHAHGLVCRVRASDKILPSVILSKFPSPD